jgi:hypothetical protein
MMPLTYDPELLRHDFENTAEYRRMIAAKYPGDARNIEAADIMEKLAATVDNVEPAVLNAYGELFEDARDSEVHTEMLRQIDVHSWPSTATEFVQGYIASRTAR